MLYSTFINLTHLILHVFRCPARVFYGIPVASHTFTVLTVAA